MNYQVADLELWFLVFCRVGGCMMLMPSFGSSRIPMRVRLFLSLIVAGVIAPLIPLPNYTLQNQPALAAINISTEIFSGVALGLVGRVLFAGLHFGANAAAMMIGLSPQGQSVVDDQVSDPFAEMFMLTAAVIFFVLDLHVDMILGLLKTYESMPIGGSLTTEAGLGMLVANLSQGFVLGLQVVAPFVAYSVLANLVFAVVNKMVPQFPAYFVSVPFILAGGLLLAYFVVPSGLEVFFLEFRRAFEKEVGG